MYLYLYYIIYETNGLNMLELWLGFVCRCDTPQSSAAHQRPLAMGDRHQISWNGQFLNSNHHWKTRRLVVPIGWNSSWPSELTWANAFGLDFQVCNGWQWELGRPPFLLVMHHSLSVCCHGFLPEFYSICPHEAVMMQDDVGLALALLKCITCKQSPLLGGASQ